MTSNVKVDYDPTSLRDVLVLNRHYASVVWGDQYTSGIQDEIKIDISDDEVLDTIVAVLSEEKRQRRIRHLRDEVNRLEKRHERAVLGQGDVSEEVRRAQAEVMSSKLSLYEARDALYRLEGPQ